MPFDHHRDAWVSDITFSGPMMCAALGGWKTETRRKPAAKWRRALRQLDAGHRVILFVKENHRLVDCECTEACRVPGKAYYEADHSGYQNVWQNKLRPSIYMPRWASRLTLEVKAIRIERLQDITEAAAIAEGARRFDDIPLADLHQRFPANADRWSMESPKDTSDCLHSARFAFANYICKLHGGPRWNLKPTNIWDENPEVAVIAFKAIRANIDRLDEAA